MDHRNTCRPCSRITSRRPPTSLQGRRLNSHYGIQQDKKSMIDSDHCHIQKQTYSSSASRSTARTHSKMSWTRYISILLLLDLSLTCSVVVPRSPSFLPYHATRPRRLKIRSSYEANLHRTAAHPRTDSSYT